MKNLLSPFLLLIMLLSFQFQCVGASSNQVNNQGSLTSISTNYKNGEGFSREKKSLRKQVKSLLKKKYRTQTEEGEKKRLPFGVIALLCLGGGFLGLLIASGIGNLTIFIGWLLSVVFGLRGLKNDKNKFPAVLALLIAGLLLLSTITFLDIGIF